MVLRPWRTADRELFATINADPLVMEHVLGRPATREESDQSVDRIEAGWVSRGFGLYAVELKSSAAMIGFIGLSVHRARPDEVEIGWRLARSTWGSGLATEGALAVRDMAFGTLGLPTLVSITIAENIRSIRVMEKLGFTFWQEQPFERWLLRIYRLTADAMPR